MVDKRLSNSRPKLERIRELERIGRLLEPGPAQLEAAFSGVKAYSENFLSSLEKAPGFIATEDGGEALFSSPVSEEPSELADLLELLADHVDKPGINPASGGHLGYIPGGGLVYSAFGDFLAAITNRYAGVLFANPGAVRLENLLIDWMRALVGYPETAAGNLTSGGSIANLIGIVTARDAHAINGKGVAKSVIYLSEQVHHSVNKAIRIVGLGDCPVRYLKLDHRYRIDPVCLKSFIDEDRRSDLNPWLVVASAGTTDTGAVDPLREIGEIARDHGLWYHVDAAYGGFFILCESMQDLLSAMDRSDSIVMDPHKGLFLPYGSGAVLVRDRNKLLESHYYVPNYLQDALNTGNELSPADLSPELTKHFRGLRMWLPLKLLGLKPFRACLEEKLLLARYFYEKLPEIDGFEVGPYPDLSVVTYRYVPKRGNVNEFNRRLIEEVHKDGRVFLSSTTLDGRFTLRLAVLSFRSHLDVIERTLEVLREKAAFLEEHG